MCCLSFRTFHQAFLKSGEVVRAAVAQLKGSGTALAQHIEQFPSSKLSAIQHTINIQRATNRPNNPKDLLFEVYR